MSTFAKYYLGLLGVRLVSATFWHSFKIRLVFFINVPCGNGLVGQNHVGLISLKYKQPKMFVYVQNIQPVTVSISMFLQEMKVIHMA